MGSWSGTYQSRGAGSASDVTVTVLPSSVRAADDVSGGALDAAQGKATVAGTIVDGGGTTLSLSFASGASMTLQGTSRIDGRGHLLASLSYDDGGTKRTVDFNLEPSVITAG